MPAGSGLDPVVQKFMADHSDYMAKIREMKAEYASLIAMSRDDIKITADNSDALAKIAEVKKALDGLGDAKTVFIGGGGGDMTRHLQDISTYMDMATDSMQRMEGHLVAISKNAQDSSADLMMQTQILRANADAHNAAATAVGAYAAATSGRGGGGGGGAAALAALAAGGGGGGGGGGGTSGAAGAMGDAVLGFVKRWWTPVHYAVMTANELAAQLLPAAAAGGAAALVGWQGVEQMIPRLQAINAAAESIGPAYGITSGSYLGTGSAIQRYQNLATGGVYELGGAGINLMRQGQGAVGQVGLNTIAMIDRGVANMQLNMQSRGTMGQLANLLSGGTDTLQSLGDLGANAGNLLLNLAPNLPGVGGDYITALKDSFGAAAGVTGFMNQHGLGPVLGTGLAAEAGARLGTPLVGMAGRGLLNLGGILPDALGGQALGETGAALMDLGMPEVAALAALAYGGSKWYQSFTPQQYRQIGGMQAGISQAGFSGAWQPLAKAITTATSLSQVGNVNPGQLPGVGESAMDFARFGHLGQSSQQIWSGAAAGWATTTGDLVNAGPQLVAALHKAGLKSVSMADAFQIAQNSLLDLTHAFDSHGQLTKQAKQMMANYVSAIGPMTQSAGAFNAAVAGQQIMSSPAMQNVSKVNQAMDSITQVMTGGPLALAGLTGVQQGLGSPGVMAKALTSFTSGGGAAAWNAFVGTAQQPGVITQSQQMMDQLRTYMTIGAMGSGASQQVSGYELKNFLPYAKQSPAALAMLMQQGAQMGVSGYYDPSKSQAQNYKDAAAAIDKMAGSSKQVNQDMNKAVIASSNLPKTAAQFSQGIGANLMSQSIAKAGQDIESLKVKFSAGSVNDLVSQFKQAGYTGGAAMNAAIAASLKQAGIGGAQAKKIMEQVDANTSAAQAKINAIHGKNVDINIMSKGAQEAQAQIDAIKGKTVTVTILEQVIQQISSITSKAVAAGYLGGLGSLPGGGGGRLHAQTGGLVPGTGSGDIIPAMLEPGEVIIPRSLVSQLGPFLAAHHIPGFGGMPQSSSSHFAAGGIVPSTMTAAGIQGQLNADYKILDTLSGAAWSKYWQSTIQPLYNALDALKGKSTSTASAVNKVTQSQSSLVTSLQNQIKTQLAYAQNVSQAAQSGLNLAGMTVAAGGGTGIGAAPPGTRGYNAAAWNAAVSAAANNTAPAQSVQQQMQSYLGSIKSFNADLKTLGKDHLNKALINQLVQAGPVQGDALAQSILSGQGGVKGANSLWAQIVKQSNMLGMTASQAYYGHPVGAASSGKISIDVNVAGPGASGNFTLTTAQIKQITEEVQAALLKQAKRNNKTGLQLPGKGA